MSKPDRLGSKTAPINDLQVYFFLNIQFDPDAEGEDYIASYTYFVYYNSIRPKDPRLPRPTYKPSPDMDYIKKRIPKKSEKNQ